jgi:hypothetical protein
MSSLLRACAGGVDRLPGQEQGPCRVAGKPQTIREWHATAGEAVPQARDPGRNARLQTQLRRIAPWPCGQRHPGGPAHPVCMGRVGSTQGRVPTAKTA